MKVWLVIDGDGYFNNGEVMYIFNNRRAAENCAIEIQYNLLAGTEFQKTWREITDDITSEKWGDVCIKEMEVKTNYGE